jgi:hypothetical protein
MEGEILEKQDLISKKDLLEMTNISYGQLYRWKRKKLIPEEWFIKKSTYTGQETFFPRDEILNRIDRIKNMKDGLSLDNLANVFSPNFTEIILSEEKIIKHNIVTKISIEIFKKVVKGSQEYSFEKILFVFIADKLLKDGLINQEEVFRLFIILIKNYGNLESKSCELLFIRKMGISNFLLILYPNEIYFEDEVRILLRLNISTVLEELKILLNSVKDVLL